MHIPSRHMTLSVTVVLTMVETPVRVRHDNRHAENTKSPDDAADEKRLFNRTQSAAISSQATEVSGDRANAGDGRVVERTLSAAVSTPNTGRRTQRQTALTFLAAEGMTRTRRKFHRCCQSSYMVTQIFSGSFTLLVTSDLQTSTI